MTPPPLQPVPAPKKKRSVLGIVLLVLLAVGGVVIVFAGMLLSFLGSAGGAMPAQSASSLQEVIVKNSPVPQKIVLIDLEGVITGSSMDRSGMSMVDGIKEQLQRAEKDDDVEAVILKVNSPGGEVLASDDIYRAIRKFQDKTGKPVIASMGSLAASGGYYVSAPCRWIVANELTLTGSIGVIMSSYNYRGLMDKIGVKPQVYKSGKFKDMLSGSKSAEEILPEEKQMVQELINETYGKFKEIVQKGRDEAGKNNGGKGRSLRSDWTSFADGRILSGKQAYELGLVDELGDGDAAIERAKKLTSLADAKLVRYARPFNLGSLLGLFGKAETSSVKVDIGFDVPKIKAGNLYFLSSSVME